MHEASGPSPAGCILCLEPPRWVPRWLRWVLAALVPGESPRSRFPVILQGQQGCDAQGQPRDVWVRDGMLLCLG